MPIFADRVDAGNRLARALIGWRETDAVVLGIPRGGLVVAAVVAHELGLPLGVVVVRKLGAPPHEEFALGAIADGVRVVDSDAVRATRVSRARLDAVEERERVELARRAALFGASLDVAGRSAIVVDDGIATGATATVACRAVRGGGAARVVLATPVAAPAWVPGDDVDEFVRLTAPRDFWAVGQFYDDFTQTTDAEVVRLLSEARG